MAWCPICQFMVSGIGMTECSPELAEVSPRQQRHLAGETLRGVVETIQRLGLAGLLIPSKVPVHLGPTVQSERRST